MSNYKIRKPVDPHVLMLEVTGTERISPNVVRVTLGGDGLDRFTPLGYDQWFRLFLARPGQDTLKLPTRTSGLWYAQYLATAKQKRPYVRCYTVRGHRPGALDVDFVVHVDADGHSGPASSFALTAKPGEQVGLLDQGCGYNPRADHEWTLLVADETGLPAVAGVCESLPADAKGIAIVELPSLEDKQDFRAPAGVEIVWVSRDGADGVPGELALETLRKTELPAGDVYAYLVGESALATGARRYLVGERQVPKQNIDFIGYWRHGHAAM
ncbi:NADPH-dependent ferric siderophore reductase [Actinoplanes lutulentus]|uniref:NADPH-dependent ferric siderophore reductase n=1 Tax=Actinoplanes lutulentus TaxID=1287878 RepID=A0A327ZB59_9ACTN|nr:siderophore-interacting protein [Actinoplanes lutulentus]MBB2941257.1 NADPH-dependent ferric siderophore reductase [Actinoplanes lutulentus]RAK36749.1 NADPH-dependent ferric siderophore reductase [Actinoplanes lutulentus]